MTPRDTGAGAPLDSEHPLRDALEFAACGVKIFPVGADGLPLVAQWRRAASSSSVLIERWWARWPSARVALVTGRRSRIAVLRVRGELGARSLAKLEREHGGLAPTPTLMRDAPPSDRILFFRCDRKLVAHRTIGAGLTVLGDGAYLVLPPIARPAQVSPPTGAPQQQDPRGAA